MTYTLNLTGKPPDGNRRFAMAFAAAPGSPSPAKDFAAPIAIRECRIESQPISWTPLRLRNWLRSHRTAAAVPAESGGRMSVVITYIVASLLWLLVCDCSLEWRSSSERKNKPKRQGSKLEELRIESAPPTGPFVEPFCRVCHKPAASLSMKKGRE